MIQAEYGFALKCNESFTISVAIELGKEYRVVFGDFENGTDYGAWIFTGIDKDRLNFTDQNGAAFSIPKSSDKDTPMEGWVVVPEE